MEKSNFEILASDLTSQERADILNKINPEVPGSDAVRETAGIRDEKSEKEEEMQTLLQRLKKESLLVRLFFRIKSIFLNISVEDAYNRSMVATAARRLERAYPGLIDSRQKQFVSGFFNIISSLQQPQAFFTPAVASAESEKETFYFILGACVMPEFTEKIKSACDVYQFPLTKPLSADMRRSLMDKLDDFIKKIPPDKKERMAACAHAYEWMKLFVKFPLKNMMRKFSSASKVYTCPFSLVREDYGSFARIMGTQVSFPDDFFSALFIASSPVKDLWSCGESSASAEQISAFAESASAETAAFELFLNKVPVRKLGRIVFENALHVTEPFSFGDGWIQKYRIQWRAVLDSRWKKWNVDSKKESLRIKLKSYFDLDGFQEFPYHPWQETEAEFSFKYGLCLGFAYYYLKKEFSKYASVLDAASLEGDFAIKENRREFTDLLSAVSVTVNKADILAAQLSANGEYGTAFQSYSESSRSSYDKDVLASVAGEIEDTAREITNEFIRCTKNLENLLTAMLGDHTTMYYGPLLNLNKIKGRENKAFRDTLEKSEKSIKQAYEVMVSLQEIDGASV
ncbi:MAG: hypothetical protein J6K96_10555 [Treponema sp.]|nr:hypothetical protein [Treponema sp.]